MAVAVVDDKDEVLGLTLVVPIPLEVLELLDGEVEEVLAGVVVPLVLDSVDDAEIVLFELAKFEVVLVVCEAVLTTTVNPDAELLLTLMLLVSRLSLARSCCFWAAAWLQVHLGHSALRQAYP